MTKWRRRADSQSVSVKTAEGLRSALTMAPTALNNYKAKYEWNARNFKPDGGGEGGGGGHGSSAQIYGPQLVEEYAADDGDGDNGYLDEF